jgi:two-component system response regulator HydG
VNVRVLASTNRDLAVEVQEGRFREDLYYRLRVVPMHLPPLRERQEDIPLLATHFVKYYTEQYACEVKGITAEGMDFLRRHAWPGNIRELRHTIERAVVLTGAEYLTATDLEMPETTTVTGPESGAPVSLQEAIDRATREHVLRTLDRAHWRKQVAADELGVDRATLYRMVKKYSISR